VTAHSATEGAGFSIRCPFPGELSMAEADPFLLLDHLGPQINGPDEAKGAPWHPHRGFETVSYILDGEIAHHDTHGGGGVIGEGDTQWTTAGGGILHDELPTEKTYRGGGPAHAVELWFNLPPALKTTTPRYQSISRDALHLLTSDDGGALIRLIAGDVAGFAGPGVIHTPVTYGHVTLAAGAQLAVPWNAAFSALAYVLTGRGTAGSERRPIDGGQLIVFGPGTMSWWLPPTGRPSRSTCCCWAACRSGHRSPTRPLRNEHPPGDPPSRRGLPGRAARRPRCADQGRHRTPRPRPPRLHNSYLPAPPNRDERRRRRAVPLPHHLCEPVDVHRL
jgi:redox-sensitive bicupin YhaK (pirin superfamily)